MYCDTDYSYCTNRPYDLHVVHGDLANLGSGLRLMVHASVCPAHTHLFCEKSVESLDKTWSDKAAQTQEIPMHCYLLKHMALH